MSSRRVPGANVTVVVITDGEQRASLAVVRDLGLAGYRCVVTSSDGDSLAGHSRYAARDVAVPDPVSAPLEFAESVARVCRDVGASVVLPVGEAAMLACIENSDLFADTHLPPTDLALLRRILDKAEVLRVAAKCGIRIPAQHVIQSRQDVGSALSRVAGWPVVLKPSRSIGEAEGGRLKAGVRYAMSRADGERELAQLPIAAYPVLLQEYIAGVGIATFHLIAGGREIASFAHRRIREKPPSGGVSVYSESVAAPADLLVQSRRLLAQLGWEGVAMVEYRQPADGGAPVLMEINPRFWGSLQLAVDAGVPFPRLYVQSLLGQAVQDAHRWRSGIRLRWWFGEIDHLIARLRGSDPGAAVTQASNAGFDWSILVPWRPGDRSEILRVSDPRPAAHEAVRWFKAL